MKNTNFYNAFAEQYNSMIDFENALPRRINLISGFVEKHYDTAADLGCGSGIDSISISNIGLRVVAYDPSSEMLNLAREKAIETNTGNIKFSEFPISEIPEEYYNKFDFITSLGNTISNISNEDISSSINNIFRLLKGNGRVIIQIVNYNRLIAKEERILNIASKGDKTYIRFYDYFEDHINFNILSFTTELPENRSLITTKVYHHKSELLKKLFKAAGFTSINIYGDLNKSQFDVVTSKDIVVVAEK